jgi:acyl-ACP thioesterase
MTEGAADRLVPRPAGGRHHRGTRRVRFGDVDRLGRVRLDALATYLQDLAGDDTVDGGLADELTWVVRRTVIEVRLAPRFLDELSLVTWCGGLGRRWAERRVSISSPGGASVEAALLWVTLDRRTGRPVPLPAGFVDRHRDEAGGREVSARLRHPGAPEPGQPVERRPFALRATDFDLLGHVNNAAAWAMVEELLAGPDRPGPLRAEIEYRLPIEPGAQLELDTVRRPDGGFGLWARGWPADVDRADEASLFLTAQVGPRPG